MKLYIVRHGETVQNVKGVIQGHLPGKLIKKGIEQARKLAKCLKKEKFDAIYASDLKRVKDTTKEIVKYHPSVSVNFEVQIRERYFGCYQGKKASKMDWKNIPLEIERISSMKKRTEKFIGKLYKLHKGKKVLVITHGGISRMTMLVMAGKSLKELRQIERSHNTSLYVYEVGDDLRGKVLVENCVKHLIE